MNAPAAPARPRNISHIAIGVTDMDASLRFYRDVIGLEVTADQTETFTAAGFATQRRGVYLRWAHGDSEPFLVLDQTLGEGGDRSTPKRPYQIGVHHFGFWVDAIEPIIERARAAGSPVALEPREVDSEAFGEAPGRSVLVALLHDPDGNVVQLDQRVAG